MNDISAGQFSQLASAVVSSLWPAVRDAGPTAIQKWIEGERAALEGALQDALFPPYDHVYENVVVDYTAELPEYLDQYGPTRWTHNGQDLVSTKNFEPPLNLASCPSNVLSLHLVRFHRALKSPEVIERLYQMHLRPGNIWELASLISKHKDGGVTLGSVAKSERRGIPMVPYYRGCDNAIGISRFDAVWRGDSWGESFLAVSTR